MENGGVCGAHAISAEVELDVRADHEIGPDGRASASASRFRTRRVCQSDRVAVGQRPSG